MISFVDLFVALYEYVGQRVRSTWFLVCVYAYKDFEWILFLESDLKK